MCTSDIYNIPVSGRLTVCMVDHCVTYHNMYLQKQAPTQAIIFIPRLLQEKSRVPAFEYLLSCKYNIIDPVSAGKFVCTILVEIE